MDALGRSDMITIDYLNFLKSCVQVVGKRLESLPLDRVIQQSSIMAYIACQ